MRGVPPVFDVDPDNAPWWVFLVMCLAFAAAVGLAMWLLGGDPSAGEVRVVLVPIVAGLTYATERLFGAPLDRPPSSN